MPLFGQRVGGPAPAATPRPVTVEGSLSLITRPPGGSPVNLSSFRGLPTVLGTTSFSDPYGPQSLTFTLPAVTIFDAIGQGDLAFLQKDADVDLTYNGPMPAGYPFKGWAFEGFLASWDWTDGGLVCSVIGAMMQVDLEQAKPEFPAQPLPYEYAISRCFAGRSYLRVNPLRIEWPNWWKTSYPAPPKGTPSYLIPQGVTVGMKWTGLLTRSTGSWEAMLTSYIQGLLTGMYTPRGRFTLDLDPGRVAVLRHRDMAVETSPNDVIVDLATPGMKPTFTEDWTQSFNVIYGQGSSLSGVGYTGMNVSPDGLTTTYSPLAAARQVEPASDKHGWFQRFRFRRETMLQVQAGLDEDQARGVGISHLQRFGDPGITGSFVLNSDPTIGGQPVPRHLIRAGMTIRIPRVFGSPDGMLFHITKNEIDFTTNTNTLTVDSKYRDALTVDEVRKRGRDSLQIARMLVAGGYQPPVPDQLLPWNYTTGSGYLPSGAQFSSLRLFKGMPATSRFPWTDWTTLRPPKAAAWSSCYVRIGPASVNANNNWSQLPSKAGAIIAFPIKMSQAGSIRLVQIAAYDADGNVLKVPFHIGLYYSNTIGAPAMPVLPAAFAARYPPYKTGQHYPFFPGAFEAYNDDGTLSAPYQQSAVQAGGPIRIYGSGYEPAGYWPGSKAGGDAPTGLLVDESPWSYDTSSFSAQGFDPYSTTRNLTNPLAGLIYALIYCDAQRQQPVYFAGRLFRTEPGTGV